MCIGTLPLCIYAIDVGYPQGYAGKLWISIEKISGEFNAEKQTDWSDRVVLARL
jgi:hypothetical protein